MRTIETNVFEYDELSKEAQEKALDWYIQGELIMMNEESPYYPAAEKAEKMRTPWFAPEYMYDMFKEELENDIRANEYTFTEDGKRFG